MKIPPLAWMPMLPVALAIGYGVGRQNSTQPADKETRTAAVSTRSSGSMNRPQRNDPFGGPRFSLDSLDEVREMFRKQRPSVAQARLTLSVENLPADRIRELMEMVRRDQKERPGDYQGRYQLMTCLFERWAQVDPTAAVAYVKECKSRSFQQSAASGCFTALARENPERAMQEVAGLPKGELRTQVAAAMLSALADHNPEMACDFSEKESSAGGFSTYYLGEVFSKWAKTDPEAAAARLATMPDGRVAGDTAGRLAATWAQTDPEAALSWAKTLKGDAKTEASVAVYRMLSLNDPQAAWRRLQGEPGYLRNKLISGVLKVVADEDPRKAAEMVKTLGSKSEQRIAVGEFVRDLRWYNAGLAFDILDQVGDPSIRRASLGDAMYYAAWTSPELLTEQSAKLTDREKIDTAQSVIRGLFNVDPAAAEQYYLALPETQRGTQVLQNLMWSYSSRDADKAFDFARSLDNPQEQAVALSGLFSNWSREDPEAAAAGWADLPAGQSRLDALGSIANNWAESDPESAVKWAEGLSGDERVRALAAVLPSLAQDDPVSASRRLASLIASPPEGMVGNLSNSAGDLARRWAGDDPAGAADWAAALPDDQARDAGLKAVAQAWSSYDAIATAEWLGTLEAGSSRDAAIEPLVQQVRQTDPAIAFSWAASISDPEQRLNQLRMTLQAWRQSDPQAAWAALDQATVSGAQRRKLEKVLK